MSDTAVRFGAIPPVISYSMPAGRQLPANTAQWRLDADRAALLIHDMQHYFLRPLAAGGSPYRELVDNIVALRATCDRRGIPVAYTAQPGGMSEPERGLLRQFWGQGMSKRAEDRDVPIELRPRPQDAVFTKWRYSAFFASNLASWLSERGRDQLVVCGVYAHVGILMTTSDAYARDIETFLVSDAVADFSLQDHQMTLDYAAARCAMVCDTTELLAMVARRHAAN